MIHCPTLANYQNFNQPLGFLQPHKSSNSFVHQSTLPPSYTEAISDIRQAAASDLRASAPVFTPAAAGGHNGSNSRIRSPGKLKEEANGLDLKLLLKSCNLEKHFTILILKNIDVQLLKFLTENCDDVLRDEFKLKVGERLKLRKIFKSNFLQEF